MQRPECASRLENPSSISSSSQHQGPDCFFTAEVRAIYNDTEMANPGCPSDALKIDGKEMTMSIRVNAVEHFENFVCYARLPQNINSIELEGHKLPVPKWDIGKVAVIGDSGCRQGPDHGGLYQSCLNPSLWPFTRVSQSVYESKPDLVVHMGDYIYREGPCTTFTNKDGEEDEIAGCKDAPYYSKKVEPQVPENFGVWQADWFEPSKYFNRVAPLILIRGNHEACKRAGIGYFRYLHHGPETACVDSLTDPIGTATQQWIVDFKDFQVGITDTSTPPKDNTAQEYANQLNLLGHYFEANKKPALFGTHYASYGWGTEEGSDNIGTQGIHESTFDASKLTDWGRMPSSFDMLLGSHIHLSSITSFEDGPDGLRNPPQVVIGNSGAQLVALSEPPSDIFGVLVRQTEVMYQYGYLILTQMEVKGGKSGKSSKNVSMSKMNDSTSPKALRNGRTKNLFSGSGKSQGSWLLEFKDEVGRNMVTCNLDFIDTECTDLGFKPWLDDEDLDERA